MSISQKEINDILLKRKLSDFYIAIAERRKVPLTDEELDELLSDLDHTTTNLGEFGTFFLETLKKGYNKYNPELRNEIKKSIGKSGTRTSRVLTIIDGELYDVASQDYKSRFFNQTYEMIVHYDNLSKFINEKEASLVLQKNVSQPEMVFFNVEGRALSDLKRYVQFYFRKAGQTDLTSKLLFEAKQKIK